MKKYELKALLRENRLYVQSLEVQRDQLKEELERVRGLYSNAVTEITVANDEARRAEESDRQVAAQVREREYAAARRIADLEAELGPERVQEINEEQERANAILDTKNRLRAAKVEELKRREREALNNGEEWEHERAQPHRV